MKKRKIASAVGYSGFSDASAPILLASGRGREAQRIINIAEEAGIQVIEDAALAALLDTSAKPGDYIPQWCWEATAKILAMVMKMENNSNL